MYSKEDFESELENRLNEFYHQKIVPLEKEIIRLGGKLGFEENQNIIDLEPNRFLPKNPFKVTRENIHYWEDKNSDYYKFFKSLFEYCLEKENSIEKKSRIDSLLGKYNNGDLIKYLRKKVNQNESFFRYDEKNIEKFEVTITRIEYDKVWDGYLVIFLKNKRTKRIELKTISLEGFNENIFNEDFKLNVPF